MVRIREWLVGVVAIVLMSIPSEGYGFWVWTPKTGRFENAKDIGKDTPSAQAKFAKEQQDQEQALQQWRSLLKRFPDSPQAAEALYNIGRIYEEMHKYYLAHKAYKELLTKYPFSAYFVKALEREYNLGLKFLQGYRRKFWDITKPIENPAPEIFDLIVSVSPNGKYAPGALYYKGLYFKKKRQFAEAKSAFEKLLRSYPDSEFADKAEYQLAMCYYEMSLDPQYDQEYTAKAIEALRRFVKKYPDSTFRSRAEELIAELEEKKARHLLEVARFYLKQGNERSAKIYLQDLIEHYSGTKTAREAEELLKHMSKPGER